MTEADDKLTADERQSLQERAEDACQRFFLASRRAERLNRQMERHMAKVRALHQEFLNQADKTDAIADRANAASQEAIRLGEEAMALLTELRAQERGETVTQPEPAAD